MGFHGPDLGLNGQLWRKVQGPMRKSAGGSCFTPPPPQHHCTTRVPTPAPCPEATYHDSSWNCPAIALTTSGYVRRFHCNSLPPMNYNAWGGRESFVYLFCMYECGHLMSVSDWSFLNVWAYCVVFLGYSLVFFCCSQWWPGAQNLPPSFLDTGSDVTGSQISFGYE